MTLTKEGIQLDGLSAADQTAHLILQRAAEDPVDHVGVHAVHHLGRSVRREAAEAATVNNASTSIATGRTDGHQLGGQTVEHVPEKLVSVLLVVAAKSRHNLRSEKGKKVSEFV